MPGLLWPIQDFPTTQRFMGDHEAEPRLFVVRDAVGGRVARFRRFGVAEPIKRVHGAIDIGCEMRTKVFAPESGRIVFADQFTNGENVVMLQIRPGTVLFFTHLFAADLQKFRRKKDRNVRRGQVIALTGNSGPPGASTGPHLHWEVRISSNPGAKVERSGRWFKWNPRRLKVGGDLAGMRQILPPGVLPEPDADEDGLLEFADGEIEETPGTDVLAGPEEDLANAPFEGAFDVEADPADDTADPDGVDDFGDFACTAFMPGGPHGHL